MTLFRTSVIIPVYNAEKFLRKAVESAVLLEEVGEVILVEDRSPDNALGICLELEKEFDKVKLFRHPNGENKGAGASRNLGIDNATYECIAFLDADDWYLPNRFEAETRIFKNSDVDGVFGATGYYDDNLRRVEPGLTTIGQKVEPENLLSHLLFKNGHFHLNAFTIKKIKLLEVNKFNTSMPLHQDTHLIYKLAFKSKIFSGILDQPIAIRRVHANNRITGLNLKSKAKLRKEVYRTFKNYKDVDPVIFGKIRREYLRLKYFRWVYEIKELFKKYYYADSPSNNPKNSL